MFEEKEIERNEERSHRRRSEDERLWCLRWIGDTENSGKIFNSATGKDRGRADVLDALRPMDALMQLQRIRDQESEEKDSDHRQSHQRTAESRLIFGRGESHAGEFYMRVPERKLQLQRAKDISAGAADRR